MSQTTCDIKISLQYFKFNPHTCKSPFSTFLFLKVEKSKSYLKCYTRQYPDLLNPVYIEEVHRNPKVFVLRNVISDAELDFIREESQDKVRSFASIRVHLLDYQEEIYALLVQDKI